MTTLLQKDEGKWEYFAVLYVGTQRHKNIAFLRSTMWLLKYLLQSMEELFLFQMKQCIKQEF
jgi:hypothetical protein